MPLTVITVKSAPQSLRGDLTKWMQEIATGVYVGNFNVKVREKLWSRVKESIGDGEATISFSYRNEIGYNYDTINAQREVADFDGIPLVLLPYDKKNLEKQVNLVIVVQLNLEKSKSFHLYISPIGLNRML